MIRYELKRSAAGKPTAIILHYRCADGPLKYYTGKSVVPAKFKPHTLSYVSSFVDNLQSDYNISGKKLTKKDLKTRLDKFLKKKGSDISDFDEIIRKMEAGELLTNGKKKYAWETIKSTKTAVRVIRDFSPGIRLSDMTSEFYEDLIVYCNRKNFSLNYVGTVIKRLKTLMRIAGVGGHEEFKIIREDTPDIALSESEILQLYNKVLADRHMVVRDWAVIGCYVGLRASDLLRLEEIHITGNNIVISNEKTDVAVTLPIHPLVKKILERNNGFPPKVTDGEFNRTIKQITKALRWNETVLYTLTKGGQRKDQYFQKWEMVSTHTCRRTFITNLLARKVPDSIIMMLAGIKSHSTLRKYNKLTPAQAANVVADLWK